MLHHVELWVPDLERAVASWGWLLTALGYQPFQDWPGGRSWRAGHTYIVVEQSPALTAGRHERCRPGLNHLAFHVASTARLDELTDDAQRRGWQLMFATVIPTRAATSTMRPTWKTTTASRWSLSRRIRREPQAIAGSGLRRPEPAAICRRQAA